MNKNISVWLNTIVLLTLCLKENFNSMAIILLGAYSLLFNFKEFNYKRIFSYLNILSIFIVATLGILWSIDKNKGIDSLNLFALFLIIPIIFSFNRYKSEDFRKINTYFSLGLFLIVLFHFFRSFYLIIQEGHFYFIYKKHKYYYLVYTRLSPFIDPTYFSLILSYSLFFIIDNLKKFSRNGRKLFILILIVDLIFFVLLFARGIQLAFLVTLLFYFIWVKKYKWYYYLIGVTLISLVLLPFVNSPVLNRYNRFKNMKDFSMESFQKTYTSESYRLLIMNYVSKNMVDFLPIGMGTGSQKVSMSKMNLKVNEGNTHNQYVDYYIQWGLLSIVLLYLYFSTFRNINKEKELWCLLFLSVIVLTSFTENLLNRHRGIVLIIYFCSFLVNLKVNQNRKKIETF